MRSLRKLAPVPTTSVVSKQTLLPSSSSYFHSSSSDDGGGGGGHGRGRGRGGIVTPFSPPDPSSSARVPGMPPQPQHLHPMAAGGRGRGRGGGEGANPPFASSTILPTFPSFLTPPPPLDPSSPAGRGRGRAAAPDPGAQQPKKPIFLRPADGQALRADEEALADERRRTVDLSFHLPGAGRGKEKTPMVSPTAVVNRHARQATVVRRGGRSGGRAGGRAGRGRGIGFRGDDDAGRGLGLGGEGSGRGRGRRGRGEMYASARGRGGRMGRLRPREESEVKGLYIGNDADGYKLARRLGEDGAAWLRAAMEEASYRALPCPREEARQDACKLNDRIDLEPEYLMEEFGTNPDIDDKPLMLLHEALDKMKPFLMAYEGIQSEEEWEEALNDVLKRSPYLKAIVDEYSGPDRVTAKEQQQELERIAKTVPESVPSSVKRFTERALLSLQNNPGWGFDKKCKFMDKLAYQMCQHYK